MALTLVTNPVGSDASKFFAGFQKCEVVFKREDLAIVDVESGAGGIQINVTTDLTGYLAAGNVIYIYSEGADYTYDGTGTILGITATDITIDIDFIQAASGGYINYKKNYFVELQCVNPTFPDANLLPFTLQSDGDAAGNVAIDVSIVNELNNCRGAIVEGYETNTVKQFEIKYREVYQGSANIFTLVDGKLFVMLYAIDLPEEGILNQLESPKLYLGYPAAIAYALKAKAANSTIEMTFRELDANKSEIVSGTLGTLPQDVNGFLIWQWSKNAIVNAQTKFIEFSLAGTALGEYSALEYDSTEYST